MMTYARVKKRAAPISRRAGPVAGMPISSETVQKAKVRRVLRAAGVQTKLSVGAPNDAYEQEADRVADAVMQMPEPRQESKTRTGTSVVQRQCMDCDDEVQRQSIDAQRGMASAPAIGPGVASEIASIKGGGRPLSTPERSAFEPRFGQDFSRVRIYSGQKAAYLASSLDARAFTLGADVVFGANQYDPGSPRSSRLLAHELTHVVQQGASATLEGRQHRAGTMAGVARVRRSSRPVGIQRSVVKRDVRSAPKVLAKIKKVLKESAKVRNARIRKVLKSLPRKYQSFVNAIRRAIKPRSHVGSLMALANGFDPGKGEDLDSNAFVYTCKGGWIDVGHFFFNAAYANARKGPMGFLMKSTALEEARNLEKQQQKLRDRYVRLRKTRPAQWKREFGTSFKTATKAQNAVRGTAWSAFTIEDMPSNKFGAEFGKSITSRESILTKMTAFFKAKRAVAPTGKTLERMMRETLGPGHLPRQHRLTTPVRLNSAKPLCGTTGTSSVPS